MDWSRRDLIHSICNYECAEASSEYLMEMCLQCISVSIKELLFLSRVKSWEWLENSEVYMAVYLWFSWWFGIDQALVDVWNSDLEKGLGHRRKRTMVLSSLVIYFLLGVLYMALFFNNFISPEVNSLLYPIFFPIVFLIYIFIHLIYPFIFL